MEGFRERQIATINTIEDRVAGHKNFLMGKKRIRYSFEEISAQTLAELKRRAYKNAVPCDNWQKREAYYRGVGEYEYIDEDFKPISLGEKWGGEDVTCFFKSEIEIPSEMAGKRVELQMYVGGDSLARVNGEVRQGLDPFRNSFLLTPCAVAGEKFSVEIEAYCYYAAPSEGTKKRTFELSALTVKDKEIEDIYWDYKVVHNLLAVPDMDKYIAEYIREALREAMKFVDLEIEDEELFLKKLQAGRAILKEKIYDCDKFSEAGIIDLVGHSHLDIVYQWDYKEFVRKVGRTHSTMLALMEEYPEFKFSQSQAVTYLEIKKHYPALYEKIKKYVKEGRWEIIGGMWVEPDCNLPSGESFVRQLLEGKKFFEKEFGVTPKTVWLPDVFGNSYGMPQILAKSGIKYFVTHKPCVWNDTNPIPHHNFWWEGPDGSRVFAALSPSHFVGTCEPNHIMVDNWNKYTDKTKVGESLYCYGWGDGGGGVSPDMIENAKRMKRLPGMPETRIANAEDALLSMLEKAKKKDLPVLKNEIYLEAHRGVPTIRTKIKEYNRRLERLWRDVEILSVLSGEYGYLYPAKRIEEGIRIMLTNQFHDILPGTHIKEGYTGVIREYEKAASIGEEIKKEALCVLEKEISFDEKRGEAFAVFNSLSYPIDKLIKLPFGEFSVFDENGGEVKTQTITDLNGNKYIEFVAKDIKPMSFKVFYKESGAATGSECASVSKNALENVFYKIKFNENGDICSIFDKKNQREVIKSVGNKLRIFGDNPSSHDAWDLIGEYRDYEIETEAARIEPFENGAVSASVMLEKKLLSSTVYQKITVYNEIDRIDFETKIDWRETQKLLKVDFDFDLITDKYTTNLAYASLERPNNAFNSFEESKFEVCAQDFLDMSEEGFGVSILSDIKNGYGVKGSLVSLSLLKAPIGPDNTCDRGINEFTYALYPHQGNLKSGKTVQKFGAFAAQDTIAYPKESGKLCESFIEIDKENITIEAVKRAESGDGIIVRVLEKYGRNTVARLSFNQKILEAKECNLMEEEIGEVNFDGNEIDFRIKPYEIKTFKIK